MKSAILVVDVITDFEHRDGEQAPCKLCGCATSARSCARGRSRAWPACRLCERQRWSLGRRWPWPRREGTERTRRRPRSTCRPRSRGSVRGQAALLGACPPLWGVTHHSLAVAVSLHSDRRHRTLRVEVGGSVVMLADRGGLRRRCRYAPGRARARGRGRVDGRGCGAAVGARRHARGYARALRFADEHAGGRRVWAVEGAGHYGAGLARHLSGRGETVLEAGRGPRNERRLQGKDDQLDAVRAARTVLASETLALPREGQRREALRLLMVARRSAVDVRREALVQLRSVIVTAPDELRQELRGLPVGRLLERCSRFRRSSSRSPDAHATTLVLRTLARRVQAATARSSRARTRDPRPRAGARTQAARRARRRPDRRRPADRQLVAQRPRPLRSSLRPARRRRTDPRLLRPNDPAQAQPRRRPPTQPRPPHRHPPPAPARPRHQRLHRTTRRRRQNPQRRRPAPQALPRPPPLPRPQPASHS